MNDYQDRPHIRLEPCVCFGQPVCKSRLPVESPCGMYWAGESMDSVLASWTGGGKDNSWPALRREDVLVAAWYLATYGTRTWRKRWGKWAEWNFEAMWHSKWDRVSNPPTAAEKTHRE